MKSLSGIEPLRIPITVVVPFYFLTSSPDRHFFCLYEFAYLGHFIKTNGFPDSSVGKESACNAGDPSSIPGSGRFPGEGKVYPLQYSTFTSLHKNKVIVCGHLCLVSSSSGFPVASVLMYLPASEETGVPSLGWEDPPEEEMATHSSILA